MLMTENLHMGRKHSVTGTLDDVTKCTPQSAILTTSTGHKNRTI